MSCYLLLLALLGLVGCMPMRIEDFAGRAPELVLERFFDGGLRGVGVLQDRFGRLQRQFTIEASGRFDEPTRTLHLEETYRFDDGLVDPLVWRIRRLDGGIAAMVSRL